MIEIVYRFLALKAKIIKGSKNLLGFFVIRINRINSKIRIANVVNAK
jgi:hypothetical protein